MAWDLYLAPSGDLWFTSTRDFQITSGTHVLEQRIRLRCQIVKNNFIFNRALGSNLDQALRDPRPQSLAEIPTFIREALEPMSDEISITDIQLTESEDGRNVLALISYYPIRPVEPTNIVEPREIRLTLPLLSIL